MVSEGNDTETLKCESAPHFQKGKPHGLFSPRESESEDGTRRNLPFNQEVKIKRKTIENFNEYKLENHTEITERRAKRKIMIKLI